MPGLGRWSEDLALKYQDCQNTAIVKAKNQAADWTWAQDSEEWYEHLSDDYAYKAGSEFFLNKWHFC